MMHESSKELADALVTGLVSLWALKTIESSLTESSPSKLAKNIFPGLSTCLHQLLSILSVTCLHFPFLHHANASIWGVN